MKPWMFVEGLSLKHVKLLVNQALNGAGEPKHLGIFVFLFLCG